MMLIKINVGDFIIDNDTYHNRCLSAFIGSGKGIEVENIPWKDTGYNPWDFKYENKEFILDPIVIPIPEPEPSWNDVIEAQLTYTAMMTDTMLGD